MCVSGGFKSQARVVKQHKSSQAVIIILRNTKISPLTPYMQYVVPNVILSNPMVLYSAASMCIVYFLHTYSITVGGCPLIIVSWA